MGKRILIADDSVTIQKAFAMTLVGEDFALTTARSADEGLTLARQTRPDLVIVDAHMPGRSGYELCAALKADAALRAIPVYILSSTQQPYDEAKGHQVGADGNLTKPWESGALIEKLKDASGRSAGAARPAAAPPAMPGSRPASSLPAAALESDYDVDMDSPRDTAPTPSRSTAGSMAAVSMPAASMPAARPAAPTGAPASGMRPSLIPGMRPGAMPPARPGTSPSRTLGATMPMQPAVPPRPAAGSAPMGRTLFGLPAASMPFPGSARSVPQSVAPAPAPAPEPMSARAPSPAMSSAVSSVVDQKVAAFAAKGPEYEALAKLSREVIEQIVWEIVPELAEVIIREQVAKRGAL